jgi:hypothetical protein
MARAPALEGHAPAAAARAHGVAAKSVPIVNHRRWALSGFRLGHTVAAIAANGIGPMPSHWAPVAAARKAGDSQSGRHTWAASRCAALADSSATATAAAAASSSTCVPRAAACCLAPLCHRGTVAHHRHVRTAASAHCADRPPTTDFRVHHTRDIWRETRWTNNRQRQRTRKTVAPAPAGCPAARSRAPRHAGPASAPPASPRPRGVVRPINAPCPQCLRHGAPMHVQKQLTDASSRTVSRSPSAAAALTRSTFFRARSAPSAWPHPQVSKYSEPQAPTQLVRQQSIPIHPRDTNTVTMEVRCHAPQHEGNPIHGH